jgi:hypothetical protein
MCILALVIQYAKRMCRITLPFVACPGVPYFSTRSDKRHDFRRKVTEHKMCVVIFSTNFLCNISRSNKNYARYHKCTEVFMYCTRDYCQIVIKVEFSRQTL